MQARPPASRFIHGTWLVLALALGTATAARARSIAESPESAANLRDARELEVHERVLAGGPEAFLTLRHLVLRGTQRAIGARLLQLARDRHGWRMPSPADGAALAERHAWFEAHAPAFLERARGVADALGITLAESSYDLTALPYGSHDASRSGCTVIWYPPARTAFGTGVLSRNYDFSTGDLRGQPPAAGEQPVTASPYLLELHPESGYATLAMCSYDLLGGVIDGMNSEGLTVALLADDEVVQRFGLRPAPATAPGLGVLQVGRHLLETCADVEEAKVALREAELYYRAIPCHYVVADRFGRSFLWENDVNMETGYVIEGAGELQVSTNFMQHLHFDDEELPQDGRGGSFTRYRTVHARVERAEGPVDREFLRATSACVFANQGLPSADRAPGRTLWRTLWFPEEQRVELDVYLGETSDEDGPVIERSAWIEVELGAEPAPEPREE